MTVMNRWAELARILGGAVPVVRFAVLVLLAPLAAMADDGATACGSLANGYGPFDYTNPDDYANKLPIVERHHFDADTERLRKGPTSDDPGSDIDYTLRAFPNHHRALYAMARLHLENKRPPNARYLTPECYFERAKTFRPSDAAVYLINGIYLEKQGKLEEAVEAYEKVISLQPNDAEAHYNLGLLYFKRKDYEAARAEAQRAYELGHPLPGLRRMLAQAGEWTEPQPRSPP